MKQLFSVFFVAVCITALSSCGPSAVDFNNKMVTIQKGLIRKLDSLIPENDTTVNLIPKYETAKGMIKDHITRVEAIEPVSDGKELKGAIIESFTCLLNVYSQSIKLMEANKKGDENMAAQYEGELADLQKKATQLDDKVEKAQKDFAKRHNFRIE